MENSLSCFFLLDRPRLLTENGNLIFQCGNNHNIYLRPSVGGGVFVGADNLTFIAEMVSGQWRWQNQYP